MIGDRYKDILFAKKLNIKSAFVLTGYGKGEYEYQRDSWEYLPDLVGENLLAVAKMIKNQVNQNNGEPPG